VDVLALMFGLAWGAEKLGKGKTARAGLVFLAVIYALLAGTVAYGLLTTPHPILW